MKRAVVIGSGMGGLVSAVLLLKHGWEVDVVEQHLRAGGFLHRFFRDGVGYDTGFHYVGSADRKGLLGRILLHLGVYDDIVLKELDPDGFDILRVKDFEIRVPAGLSRWRDRLVAAFPSEANGIDRFFAMHADAVAAYGLYNLDPNVPPDGLLAWERRTVLSVLDACVKDPTLRAVLVGQSALYGVAPDVAPFGMHAIVSDHFAEGAWAIEGGGDRLALALVRRIRSLGGRVHLGTPATALEVGDDREVQAVIAGERRFPAELVVAGIHPKCVLDLLPAGSVRPAYSNRVTQARAGTAHLGLYLRATSGDLAPLKARNLYALRSTDLSEIARPSRPGDVPFLFVTAPGWRERSLPGADRTVLAMIAASWEDCAMWRDSTLKDRPPAYEAYKAALAETALAAVCEALPGVSLEIVEASTPLTTEYFTRSPDGATYGHHHAVDQMGLHRLPHLIRVRNVVQVGQATGFPGICGAAMSAYSGLGLVLGVPELFAELRAQ